MEKIATGVGAVGAIGFLAVVIAGAVLAVRLTWLRGKLWYVERKIDRS